MTTRLRRPQLIDLAMIVASVGSFLHHINGAGSGSILIWWTVWAVLWVLWGRLVGSLLGAVVSLVVMVFVVVGPRTDLGFAMQRDCFDEAAQAALVAHVPGQSTSGYPQGDGRCGLMSFDIVTQPVSLREPGGNGLQEERSLTVWFRDAGEKNWGLFNGNGMVYSPQGEPTCGVVTNSGCRPESAGDGWYYYSFTRDIN